MTTLRPELLDELLAGYETPEDLLGEEGLFRQLKKALLERALGAELSEHLGYEKGDPAGRGTGNSRNGYSDKTVLSEDGEIDLSVPRDRNGTFEPLIVPKGERRLDGFDERIISLYARGMTVREIQGHLQELYGVEVSPDLISRVTDAVLEEVREWQNRPLDAVYPVVFFDALRVKIRDEGLVRNKAVYVALAITCEGDKEVLGLWIAQTEGAKFWLKVMNELHARGVGDILIAVVDGLTGFPEAIGTVFPKTTVQTPDRVGGRLCIVHLIRNSLAFVSWKDRRKIMPDIRAIYRAETAEAAAARLDEFEARWGAQYPAIAPGWRRAWEQVVPMFAFPPAIRKMISTTNALESLHRFLRKIIKTRGSFPNDEAAIKLLFLAIRNAGIHWPRPVEWTAAMGQFAILFEDRFPASARCGRKACRPRRRLHRTSDIPPPGETTHWTGRAMAKTVGISLRAVQRIWEAHRLQPHRWRTFKRSNDPAFAEKVEDVVGLYMHPPAHSIVLSIDEKSQIQALDRTQPGLPLKPGKCGTMTHDYKRHGTTTLFAALNVLDGTVLGRCMQKHSHQEFIRFLNAVERAIPPGKIIHAIADNGACPRAGHGPDPWATHKHPKVRAWLARHPRWVLHFTPTSASWLNAVENFFSVLSKRRLKRGVFTSIVDLQAAINHCIEEHNDDPKPFIWTKPADTILAKINRLPVPSV